ncbi:MAG: (Na+)-NQR maturation NqrM, partial [Planctomycetaceae bacterium]|nr:(Na+)-NQR maturation NqrM [Planctomycetaceae bacterium]
MMTTVLFALGIFVLAFLGMAVGVIFSNRCIKGSCGGLSNLEGVDGCSQCGGCSVSDQKQKHDQIAAANSSAAEDEE